MDVEEQNTKLTDDKTNDFKPDLTAISLTHVQYIKGDFIGYILAWCSLVPFCILVAFVTLIIFRRDLHTASYFCGLLLNEIVNWVLKQCIREQRPQTHFSVLYSECGMPSSHSQFMFFFTTYLFFFLFVRIHRNYNWVDDIWKYVAGLGFLVCSSLVSYSRIYLGYHTSRQVLWGGVVGTVLGCVWFTIVQTVLTPFFPYIASSPLGELLMLRDSTLIPHVLWFEYTSSRSEARVDDIAKGFISFSLLIILLIAEFFCLNNATRSLLLGHIIAFGELEDTV